MPVFFTFLNTVLEFGGGHAIKQLPQNHQTCLHAPACYDYRSGVEENFELLWFEKLVLKWI